MEANSTDTTKAGAESIPKTKRSDNISTDGKRKSFPKVPSLLHYIVAVSYYAICKVNGKPVRASYFVPVRDYSALQRFRLEWGRM